MPWASIIFDAIILATMIQSHDHPSILYGFLVQENMVGVIVFDVLGYNVYFP